MESLPVRAFRPDRASQKEPAIGDGSQSGEETPAL